MAQRKRKETIALQTQAKRQLDMLHGPIWSKIPRFALPVAATAILEQLFNASDIAVVGNFTGDASTAAVAAVGANSPIIGLLVNLFIGIALGANAVSSLLLFRRLHRGIGPIRLEPGRLRIDGPTLRRILRIGLPAGIQSAVFAVSNIVIQSAVNSLGTVVMAASSAAFNIEIFTYDILNAFSQACTTFVGQNFGAGQIDRCRRTLALCLAERAIFLGAAILLLLSFGKPLLSLFNQAPEVIATGYIRLTMVMLSHSFSLLYEGMSGCLRGFGISLTPAALTMLGVCGVRISWVHWVFPGSPTFRTLLRPTPSASRPRR